MSFAFLLDGVRVQPPVNNQDVTTTIKRGANFDGFLVTQDVELTWTGDAYTYLYNKFYNDGFCTEVEVGILDETEGGDVFQIYEGVIKMSAIKIDAHQCTVKAEVLDRSFYAYINNNKSVQVVPTAVSTKNGEPLTPLDIYDITVFNPSDGTVDPDTRKAYRVYDLMGFVIRYITDNKVTFASDFLQSEELFLTKSRALAVAGALPHFSYSFEELYTELTKIFNLSFIIEPGNVLRMEQKGYFYSSATGLSFTDVGEMKISADQSKIYGTVIFGSSTLSDSVGQWLFDEDIPYFGFKQESFYPLGQCNLNTELNLVNDYVLSSNVIEDCVIGLSPQYYTDNKIFVSCENIDTVLFTADAKQYTLNNIAPPYIYNLNLNNYNKAKNYYGYIGSDLLSFFDVSSNDFRAERGAQISYYLGTIGAGTQIPFYSGQDWRLVVDPAPFPNETSPGNYDLGGNYDNTTMRYTVPVDGTYTFSSTLFVDLQQISASIDINHTYIILYLQRFNAGNVIQDLSFNQYFFPSSPQSFTVDVSGAFDCVATDYVVCKFEIWARETGIPPGVGTKLQFKIRQGSFFKSHSDALLLTNTQRDFKIINYEFTYPISGTNFRTLLTDPKGLQTFTKWSESDRDFVSRQAWIEEIKYNNHTGFATIKLVANDAITEE